MGITLGKNFLADGLVFANHLNGENVVDFNPVSRDSVLQEARGEHHVVTSKPELGVILTVKVHNITGTDETESSEDHEGNEQVKGNARVVQGTILDTKESGENGSLDGKNVIDLNVEVVEESEGSVESVLTVLSGSHLNGFKEATNSTTTGSQTLIN